MTAILIGGECSYDMGEVDDNARDWAFIEGRLQKKAQGELLFES